MCSNTNSDWKGRNFVVNVRERKSRRVNETKVDLGIIRIRVFGCWEMRVLPMRVANGTFQAATSFAAFVVSAVSLTIVKEVCRNRVDVHVKKEREEGTCWTIRLSRLRTYGEKDCGAETMMDGGLRYYGVVAATHAVAHPHSRFSSFSVPLLSLTFFHFTLTPPFSRILSLLFILPFGDLSHPLPLEK